MEISFTRGDFPDSKPLMELSMKTYLQITMMIRRKARRLKRIDKVKVKTNSSDRKKFRKQLSMVRFEGEIMDHLYSHYDLL